MFHSRGMHDDGHMKEGSALVCWRNRIPIRLLLGVPFLRTIGSSRDAARTASHVSAMHSQAEFGFRMSPGGSSLLGGFAQTYGLAVSWCPCHRGWSWPRFRCAACVSTAPWASASVVWSGKLAERPMRHYALAARCRAPKGGRHESHTIHLLIGRFVRCWVYGLSDVAHCSPIFSGSCLGMRAFLHLFAQRAGAWWFLIRWHCWWPFMRRALARMLRFVGVVHL